MALETRAVKESPLYQGEDEIFSYSLTTTPWLIAPTSTTIKVKELTNNFADVTSTLMPTNAPTINGDVILTSPLMNVGKGHIYRLEIKFSKGGITVETYLDVYGEM